MPGLPPGLAGAKMAHQGAMQSFPDRKVESIYTLRDGKAVRHVGMNDAFLLGMELGAFPAPG